MNAPESQGAAVLTGRHQAIGQRGFAILFLVMLITAMGNSAMQSLLPGLGAKLGVPDVVISAAVSWSALLWTLSASFWSDRSQRSGRRRMMKIGIGGFLVSMLLVGLALMAGEFGLVSGLTALLLFVLFRSIYGLFGSAAPPAVQAYVAARTAPRDRMKYLSLIASSFGLGTVIGPAIAPYLVIPSIGASTAFLIFALIAALFLLLLHFGLPNDAPQFDARGRATGEPISTLGSGEVQRHDDGEADDADIPGGAKLSYFDRRVRDWFAAGLILANAQSMLMGVIGFLILDRLALRATPEAAFEPTGLALTFGALASLLAQWGLIPLTHMGPRKAVLFGSLLAGLGTFVMMVAGSYNGIILGFALASLGFGLFRPGFTGGASLAVKRHEQDRVAGRVTSVNGAAWVVAPALGVAIYGVSETALFVVVIAACLATFFWSRWKLPTGLQEDGESAEE